MSKDIESIVQKILPEVMQKPFEPTAIFYARQIQRKYCMDELLEAITSGVLFIPLSQLEIFTELKTAYFDNSEMTGDQLWLKLSEAVHSRQFVRCPCKKFVDKAEAKEGKV